jgi:spore coat protein U-like protein
VSAPGTINITCTFGTPYDIDLGQGNGGVASNRVMKGTKGGTINYNLYYNRGNTQVWGSTMTGGNTYAGWAGSPMTGAGAVQSIQVNGLIAGGQSSTAPDIYSDTVLITVSY